MERNNPIGPGAVTEFDELFKIGYKAIVECIVESSTAWEDDDPTVRLHREKRKRNRNGAEACLVSFLEQLTESLLLSWLSHSRTLRLSVLERTHDNAVWQNTVTFIQQYGGELFTQRFLNLGNLRAILHQGTANWLRQLKDCDMEFDLPLIDDLDQRIKLDDAAEHLSLVLEAVVENYGEYRDYNSTTTQSDQGNMLYTLLDFLRLRTKYDRVCWNLKPVIWAHEILVRRGVEKAARMWRRALAQRINEEAEQYLRKLAQLQKKYAMRMPTVADRLAERFVRPMAIDRICALVEPAIRESKTPGPKSSFEMLSVETDILTREPTGVGLDVPAWLVALEEQVDRIRQPKHQRNDDDYFRGVLPQLLLSAEGIEQQLLAWCNRKSQS
jgi:hypothetical protein